MWENINWNRQLYKILKVFQLNVGPMIGLYTHFTAEIVGK